jgi:sRNA-binding protein
MPVVAGAVSVSLCTDHPFSLGVEEQVERLLEVERTKREAERTRREEERAKREAERTRREEERAKREAERTRREEERAKREALHRLPEAPPLAVALPERPERT